MRDVKVHSHCSPRPGAGKFLRLGQRDMLQVDVQKARAVEVSAVHLMNSGRNMNGGLGISCSTSRSIPKECGASLFFPFRGATDPGSAHEQGERRFLRELPTLL